MDYETILLGKEGGVAVITLNRPEKLNALNVEMRAELASAITELNEDDDTKVLVFTGAGRGFCSGADLSPPSGDKKAMGRRLRLEPLAGFGRLARVLAGTDKPTIAAVNGVAAGAGFAITVACDIRIASENASFSAIFVRRALVPDTGISYFLPRIVGISKAVELCITGDIIDVKEAERIGLVSKVVPHDDLMREVKELATRLAGGPSIAIELAKRSVYRGLENNLTSQLIYEDWAQDLCHQSEDSQEGRRSFIEKRPPVFKGI
ncbi:enoyl-CoA hydratase/isomerase family protein [Chloroflexota bacterium]